MLSHLFKPKSRTALIIILLLLATISIYYGHSSSSSKNDVVADAQNVSTAPSAITPTFGIVGDCQTTGTCPSVMLSQQPSAPQPNTTQTPPSVSQTNPTTNPCVTTTVTTQAYSHGRTRHHWLRGGGNGFFSLLLKLLQLILNLLGGSGSNPIMQQNNGQNQNTNPCPSPTQVPIAQPSPTQPSPTVFVTPTNGITQAPSATSGPVKLVNPFPGGWVPNRLDMGYDGTFKGQIVAPFTGTVTYAGLFNGWNGSLGVIIKADADVGLPTRSLFFTEGVKPVVTSGQHVTAGTPIANAYPSPYGNSYGQGANGAIEWGVSQDGPIGQQVDTYAIKLGTGTSAARQMVLNFATWAEQKLGLPPPSSTSNAGSP